MSAPILSRPFFRIYGLLWKLAGPFLKKSRRLADGWQERHAPEGWLSSDFPSQEGGHAVDVWLQAASGGEARLAVSVCQSLDASLPLRVLVVTWTRQGRDVVEKALPSLAESHPRLRIAVRFAPFDHPAIVARAMEQASPRLVALLETELWPGLLAVCRGKDIPVCVVNGRITSSTIRFGKLLPSLMADIAPSSVHAISEKDRLAFASIFPCRTEVMPNIKFDLAALGLSALPAKRNGIFGVGGPVFLFASVRTHEETRLPSHLSRIREAMPEASVVIVPRHLHRVDAWRSLLDDLGLRPILLSQLGRGQTVPKGQVLVWDRFGDLPQLYASARAVFVGGSFGQGGQNFLEALSAGRIPCIGPSADNFLWAMGSDTPEMPTLEEAGLLRVAQTPAEVIDIMLEQAAVKKDREALRESFRLWLGPRLGGSARAARLLEAQLAAQD